FNPRKLETKNFTNKDGLQDGEFNPNASYKNWQGELFFGGSDGLNIFLPKELPLNDAVPKVVLTDFIINYESVEPSPHGQLKKHISIAEEVTLFPDDNKAFSFEFVALNYTQPEKNSYKFKLENYDDTWKYPKNQNIAFYTNIDPGEYTFRVQAANNDDKWNEEGASIKVIIQPTLVQTWYFKVGLLLAAVGIGYLIYLNRVRSLRQRSITLEKMVKERTEQLQRKNGELAKTVKTLENTQQQLIVSEKMASLGQLTAGIAHEINNPINFISSNVQALKMDFQDMQNVLRKVKELEKSTDPVQLTQELIKLGKQLDFDLLEEEISELLGGIERGTERTVNIVSSLRTFSRNSTDNFAKADIHEGIDSTITILNSQINGHILIKRNYARLPLVKCQISRLNQVFLNIINNSIQAINNKIAEKNKSNGSITRGLIEISTKKLGNQIQISIKDNGNGMDEITKKRLFEPFYTTKDVGEGTGLGLSISYGIIEQHKGKIEVFSQVGVGTEFLIYLPISQVSLGSRRSAVGSVQ
ncbi:MAG: ATP-binding protein, partial [Bacteroidota bacterium]